MPSWSKPLPTGQEPGDKCSLSEVYSNCSLEDPGSFQPSCPQWWPTKQIFSQQPSLLFHFPKPPLPIPDNLRLALGEQALGSSFLNTWGLLPVLGQKFNTSTKQAGLVPFISTCKWDKRERRIYMEPGPGYIAWCECNEVKYKGVPWKLGQAIWEQKS